MSVSTRCDVVCGEGCCSAGGAGKPQRAGLERADEIKGRTGLGRRYRLHIGRPAKYESIASECNADRGGKTQALSAVASGGGAHARVSRSMCAPRASPLVFNVIREPSRATRARGLDILRWQDYCTRVRGLPLTLLLSVLNVRDHARQKWKAIYGLGKQLKIEG